MQADLDSALIAAVKKVTTSSTDTIKATMKGWFAAQTTQSDYDYDDIDVSSSAGTTSATMTGHIPTTFMSLIGLDTLSVNVTSAATGPSTSYLNVHIVLDNPASMMLAATAAITESTAENYSYFDQTIPALTTLVGAAGDGSTSTKPRKLVPLVADGTQSSLSYIASTPLFRNEPYE